MPKIELGWYASFLMNMHGFIFISMLISNMIDIYVRYGKKKIVENPVRDEDKELFNGFYEAPTFSKLLTLFSFVLKVTTSCFYMMAIVFITDRGIA